MREVRIVDGNVVTLPKKQPHVLSLGRAKVMSWFREGNLVRYVVLSEDLRYAILMSVEVAS